MTDRSPSQLRKIAAEARWLMKPNFSREGLSLKEAAAVVGLSPQLLDLLLWNTNGGLKLNTAKHNERVARVEGRRADPGEAA